jgi:hypothetical protein
MPKTVSKTRLQKGGQVPKQESDTLSRVIPEPEPMRWGPPPGNEWHFKITGRGSSGWMAWVLEYGTWVQLRPSNTSFISAVAAIEPELMRLAFPHKMTERKPK